MCAACGLDLRAIWQPVKRGSKLPIIAGLAIAIVIATVGAVLLFGRGNEWTPDAESSPSDSWHAFTSPDGAWSVMFPGSSSPTTESMSMDVQGQPISITMYMTQDGGTAYATAYVSVPPGMTTSSSGDLDSFGSGFQKWIRGSNGSVTGSRHLTFKGYDAAEIKFSVESLDGYARYWIASRGIYLMLAMGRPGTTMYPEHFFESLDVLKP
jgi:hypothetical protein